MIKKENEYLEYNLPIYVQRSIDEYREYLAKVDAGYPNLRFDLYYDALNANINSAENGFEISSEQAWFLREKYLGVTREDMEI